MDKEIENYIELYERKQRKIANYERQVDSIKAEIDGEIESLENQIAYLKRKYEKLSRPINDKIDEEMQELDKLLLTNVVSIKLEDILNELSQLTNENVQDIHVSGYHTTPIIYPNVNLSDIKNKQQLIEKITNMANYSIPIFVYIEGIYKTKPYCLTFTYLAYLSDIWTDGKTLLEHCNSPKKVTSFNKNSYTPHILSMHYKLDEIKEAICSFNLKQIIDFKTNNDLLSKAVTRYLDKQKCNDKPVSKIKKM